MKPSTSNRFLTALLAASGVVILSSSSFAATATKAGTGTDLNAAASWSGGSGPGFPTSADVATWGSTSLGAGLTLGSNASWGSINVTGALSDIDITGAGTLTLGTNITLTSTAPAAMSISNAILLNATSTWTTATGKTLTLSGNVGSTTGTFRDVRAFGNGTTVLSGVGTTKNFARLAVGNTNSSATTSKLNITGGTASFTSAASQASIALSTVTGARSVLGISGSDTIVNAGGDFVMFNGNTTLGANTSSAVINQSNGTFNINTTSGVLQGWSANSYGGYVLSGGTLNFNSTGSASYVLGNQDRTYAVFSQSGGTANFKNSLFVGQNNTGGAVVDISGGSLNHTGGSLKVGIATGTNGSIGVVNVRGTGTLSTQNGNFLITDTTGGFTSSGIVNLLTGGTIEAHTIAKAGSTGTATINADGGTLKVFTTNGGTNFLQGLDNMFIRSGGLTVDTAGQDVTIGQAMTAPAGFGVGASGSTIAVASGGTGYVGAPVVLFAAPAGGGVAATGVATIDSSGTVTGITVTSPGSGYASGESVAVTFNSGNTSGNNEAVTRATGFSVSASTLNASGGFTKSNTGTLKLTATSTYTGNTSVTGGSLIVNGNISTSPLTSVSGGATLGGTGTVGAASVASGGIFAPGDAGIESLDVAGTLTLASGSISNFEISATANTADLAAATAAIAFGGTLNVSNLAGTLANGQLFNLFDWVGTASGTFSSLNLPSLDPGLTWDTSNLYTAGTIVIVPEPRAALLGAIGFLMLLRRRR